MHTSGVAHRDLKLENIMLDATHEHLKVGDFGFAREVRQGDLSRTFCGSLVYAAPELLRHEDYCPFCSDVWSLGVILVVLLTGRALFAEPSRISNCSYIVLSSLFAISDH